MSRKRRFIAFGLAVLLGAMQLAPLQMGSDGQVAKAAEAEEQTQPTSDPNATIDPNATVDPNATDAPIPTSTPEVTSDRVDLIPATGGAVYVEDKNIVVTGLEVGGTTTNSIELSWDSIQNMEATGYYVYRYDATLKDYVYVAAVTDTKYTVTDLPAGKEYYFTVSAFNEEEQLQSYFCEPLKTYTRPEQLKTIQVKTYTRTTITIKWSKVESATGYLVYRATETGSFALVGSTTSLTYQDTGLTNGTTYRYMVRSYAVVTDNVALEYSSILLMTTKTKATTVTAIKGGTKRVRIKWKKLAKADGYEIFRYNGTSYVSIAKITSNTTLKYIDTGLKNGQTYQYKVCGYRIVGNTTYDGVKTSAYSAKPVKVAKTTKTALLYKTKKAFKKSSAYKTCKFFKKKVKYAKSIIIPGLKNTNLNGFGCTTMVPQGMTFAKKYMLITAYDSTGVENSVIYVIKKSTRKLVTTVELPNTAHAGGIAYDGTNIWIAQSNYLRSIKFSKISSAISKNLEYVEIPEYDTKIAAGQQVATITYYKKLLWVASYNELSSGYLGSYSISNKTGTPTLKLCARKKIANRVQGIAFTSSGYLILSRSCQTNAKQRGFLHQLDVYKPNMKKAAKGKITLGRVKKHVDMPTMNEEIAVSGSYLYVNYESAAFSSAVNRVDRVCAFKVSAVVK